MNLKVKVRIFGALKCRLIDGLYPPHTHTQTFFTMSSAFVALISPQVFCFLFFLYISSSFHRLKGLIRDFYNAVANQQTCLLLLPLTWMQQQPSFPFSRLPGEHIKHMPSAPEAMKYKSTNKWISNHKGKKNKEPLNYVGKTGLSEQFLCFWAFCVRDNPKCILGNTSGSRSLISLDLCSLFFFWSSNM